MEQSAVYVSLEFTPNPNTLKYSVNRKLIEKGAANFVKLADAEARSPLAAKLLNVAGISGVMLGKDFVTITKSEDGDWDFVHKSASDTIEKYLTSGEPIIIGSEAEVTHMPLPLVTAYFLYKTLRLYICLFFVLI